MLVENVDREKFPLIHSSINKLHYTVCIYIYIRCVYIYIYIYIYIYTYIYIRTYIYIYIYIYIYLYLTEAILQRHLQCNISDIRQVLGNNYLLGSYSPVECLIW